MQKEFQLQVNGIINMPNLTPTEKFMMVQFTTLESLGVRELHITHAYQQSGWTRHGWRKIALQLIDKGFVEHGSKRGYYRLTNTNVY